MKKNKKVIILIGMLGILFLLSGISYAVFSYRMSGSLQTIKTGDGIAFKYQEGTNALSLNDAMPMTDEQGKAQANYFEFEISGKTTDNINIPYYITARKKAGTSNIDEAIKLYLTKVNNGIETEVELVNYSELNQYNNQNIDLSKYTEKLLHSDQIFTNSNYNQTYRLRMWIDYNTDFTNSKYQNATFGLTVNVYSKGRTITDAENYVAYNGQLHVTGSKLYNQYNEEVRLVGASGGDLAHYQGASSYNSIKTLKGWGANTYRFFTNAVSSYGIDYVEDADGCINGLKRVIDNVIANDMYIILVWSGNGSNGMYYSDYALDFFTRIANLYPNDPHIIFEIWNEPERNNTWSEIKEYANKLIPAIREISPDSLIIVGTPDFDSNIKAVINDKLNYENTMYTHHTYMNGFAMSRITDVKEALEADVPVFETEWGPAITSPNGDSLREPLANAWVETLNKYNISHVMFAYVPSSGPGDERFCITRQGEWNENLPDSVLKDNGKYMKKVISGNYNFDKHLMIENIDTNPHSYRSNEWKDKIVSIEFKNKLEVPDNAVITWDLSFSQNGSIIGYLLETTEIDRYKLIICANGTINAPTNSNYLFADMSNLKTIDFTNFTTDYVVSMSGTFRDDKKLETLDLSGFNTDEISQMWTTFYGCESLVSIDFTGWHPKLVGLASMFYRCKSLTSLDLSGFNVDNTTSFASVFDGAESLTNINISTWKPNRVTSIGAMFSWCKSLNSVNMSSFEISSSTLTTSNNALLNVPANATFTVKNQEVIDILSPTATNNINFVINQ